MGYTPHVAVVGGGATGAGVARDLAMRGLDVTLVEKGTLTNGATGRMHGLLHSGARYAVSDPQSARDCIEENQVLRDIASHCVEEVGGLVAELPEDPDGHFEEKREACEAVDIPVGTLTGEEARAVEPGLSDAVERALEVPDAAIDPFRLTTATARSARNYGAALLTHAEVIDVMLDDGIVDGLRVCENDPTSEGTSPEDIVELDVDYVVNATGAWADELAAMARVDVEVRRSKGAMAVTADRHVETVVNRCRPRSQGDIVVPHGDVSILGTTDEEVENPEKFAEEGWEIDLLFDELSPVVPSLSDARTLRSYWGVRPLYEPADEETEETTDLSRDYVLLDHEERDDRWGMTTVVGGKLTTHRLIAEDVADHVCEKFGIRRECHTDDHPLPGSDHVDQLEGAMAAFDVDTATWEQSKERMGSRAADVLNTDGPNPLVCPCERVTRAEVQDAIDDETVFETDLNALRVHTGVGTGDCQGMRCCHRVAAELYPLHSVGTVRDSLDGFYQERWDGQRHSLWGEQLSRAMTSYALHATTMNRDRAAEDGTDEEFDLDEFDDGPAFDDDIEPSSGGFEL